MNRARKNYILLFVLLISLPNIGAILKGEDPILDTQSDGILLDQKLEQEKDGVKAPATPSMEFYDGEDFFSDPPFLDEIPVPESQKRKDNQYDWSNWWTESNEAWAPEVTKEEVKQDLEALIEYGEEQEKEDDSNGVVVKKDEESWDDFWW